jgi:hypothetical protein
VADPDPDHEALAEVGGQLGVLGGQPAGFSLVDPDVDDRGADDERLARLEQRPNARQLRRAAEPEGAEAELLDQRRRLGGVLLADLTVGGPDAEGPEIHRGGLYDRGVLGPVAGRDLAPCGRSSGPTAACASISPPEKGGGPILSHMLGGTLEVQGR